MKFILRNGVEAEGQAFKMVDGKKTPIPDNEVPQEAIDDLNKKLQEINFMNCESCKTMSDCRPYGPKGQEICGNCASQDTVSTYLAAKAHKGEEYADGLLKQLAGMFAYSNIPVDLSKMN